MVLCRDQKLWCLVAGSGVVLGILSYFRGEKKCAHTFCTPNFTSSVKWDYNWDKTSSSSADIKRRQGIAKSLVRFVERRRRSRLVLRERGQGDANVENPIDEERQVVKLIATRNLFFIRHGHYKRNGNTDADKRLTSLGRLQAEYTGLRLKELNFKYTSITQSTMTRAMETAEIILDFLPRIPLRDCELICEGAPIPPDPPVGHWAPEQTQLHEDGARIEAAFRKYFYRADPTQSKNSYEIFVCHANVIRYFVCRALQFPPEAWLRFYLHHGSVTWIAIRPSGRVQVYYVGDCGHIPVNILST